MALFPRDGGGDEDDNADDFDDKPEGDEDDFVHRVGRDGYVVVDDDTETMKIRHNYVT